MLIKDGGFVEDEWQALGDDEVLPASAPVTVSLARWTKERGSLTGSNAPLGLLLPNDVAPSVIAGDLGHFALIVLNFPRFTDGRAYSQARLPRDRFGFRGELRAAGNVLRDQLLFMKRCGFDRFEVGERAVAENWLAAFGEFDVFYQPAEDRQPTILQRRLGAR